METARIQHRTNSLFQKRSDLSCGSKIFCSDTFRSSGKMTLDTLEWSERPRVRIPSELICTPLRNDCDAFRGFDRLMNGSGRLSRLNRHFFILLDSEDADKFESNSSNLRAPWNVNYLEWMKKLSRNRNSTTYLTNFSL